MDQQQRLLIAFALSFAILMLWGVLFQPPPRKTTPPAPPRAPGPAALNQAPGPLTPRAPVQLPIVQGSRAEEIVVESDLYRVSFSTQGAVIKSWVLKKYRDAKEEPLDVINRAACEQLGFPMSLTLLDPEASGKVNGAIYVATPSATPLLAPVTLSFTYSDGKIQARKQFSFGLGYEVRAELSVFDGRRYLPMEVAWPGGFGDHSLPSGQDDSVRHAVYATTEKLTVVAQGKVKEDSLIPGPLELAGLDDRYFVDIFLPGSPEQAFERDVTFRITRRAWTPSEGSDGKGKEAPRPLVAMLGGPLIRPLSFRLFLAPRDLDVLHNAKPPLDRLVDFGWFSIVAKPLFLALRYIYDHWVHNYGWAIVILTVLINLLMFPLKLKSLRSAQEMQRIAPLVKSIQDKYKQYKFNDPRKQRMNQEVMKLYQEHNINPLGGCLPMLLQLPFLYAFYNVLNVSIELRHAPWFLWIRDLASPDKFRAFGLLPPLLPTVMIVTMYILQKMTPVTAADPAQQRMMMIMPLFFGIMFYNFPSGLVLYWLTGNVVGIAQQVFINRMTAPAAASPAPRKVAAQKGID